MIWDFTGPAGQGLRGSKSVDFEPPQLEVIWGCFYLIDQSLWKGGLFSIIQKLPFIFFVYQFILELTNPYNLD